MITLSRHISTYQHLLQFFLIEQSMETQLTLEKLSQSSYRQNLLNAMATSSIKRNKIRGFINAGSGSSQINFMHNDQNSQLAEHLLHLKTSCSGVKVEIKNKEYEQDKFRDSTMFISQKVKNIQNQRNKLEQEIDKLKTIVEDVKSKKVNAMLCFKSYEHILDRMKKDQIRYQIKKNQLEKQLKVLEKNFKDLDNVSYQLKQYDYLSSTGLSQARSEIEGLCNFRKTTLDNMSRVVDEKEILQRKKQDRKEKSHMIKQMAAGDLQDADLIRIKKFLTVQVFLKALLKSKIQKLKEFFQPYELAFLKIKGNTNVKDASSLKSQYYSFESSYNEKAVWVKYLQQEISKCEEQKKQLNQEFSDLKQKQLQIFQQHQQQQCRQNPTLRKQLQEKAENSEVLMMSVREWLKQQSKKMGIQSGNKSQGALLKQICGALKKCKPNQQTKQK